MTPAELINEFQYIETMAKALSERSYHARKHLERLSAPAPSGGKKKRGLTPEQEAELRIALRTRKKKQS
jgi:hypothetical protein